MDTTGLLLKVDVHPADVQDRAGAQRLLAMPGTLFPRLAMLWADAGYQGPCADWITATLGRTVEIVRTPRRWVRVPVDAEPPPMPTGFQVVERTFAWLGRHRRLSKDVEELPATEEAWIYLVMIRLLVARRAR